MARGPPGAIMASMESRPRYRTDEEQCGCRGQRSPSHQREEDRCGMATTRLSPFISANEARHAAQRLRWSSIRTRRLPPSCPFRYARKSGRNSAQPAPAAFFTSSQTRSRAASSVPASTSSCFISCSACSSRSSDIVDLLSTRRGFEVAQAFDLR